jgi:hypothetical protein
MNMIVSEDALRRALERIDEGASNAWLRPALMHAVREALAFWGRSAQEIQ